MDPALYQPPLHWWSHVWRYGLAFAISFISWIEVVEWQAENAPGWLWADVTLGIGCFVLVWWRREYPILVNVLSTVFASVSTLAAGPAVLALTSLATRRKWQEIVPISILAVIGGMVLFSLDPNEIPLALYVPLAVAMIGVNVGWGMFIGSRRELMTTLRDRAVRAEEEQSMRVGQARTAERSRIAREMHDVMAHRISLVTMHAGALAYRDDLEPAQVKATAQLIQQTSHQALTELREVLGVLRADDEEASDRPQPSGRDLATLIDESRAAGMSVRASLDLNLVDVPVTVGRTLYRIVQESLTNARKHAPGTTVDVVVEATPDDGVTFTVSNPPPLGTPAPVAGSGLGLMGLTERAELVGGNLNHRQGADGSFSVTGWLPWPT